MAKNDAQINEWNEQWRSSPQYAEIMASIGIDPSKPMKLSDQQRRQVKAALEQMSGQSFDKGLEIDPAGNINQNEGFGKQAKKWGPLAGGIALTLFGIPGVMPGILSAGGGAAATAAGATGSATGSAATAAATGGGMFSGMMNFLKGNALPLAGMAGRALTGASEASAQNRGSELAASMDAHQINQQAQRDWMNQMLLRSQEGRNTRNDAWKALQQGAYTRDWKPSGQSFSPYTRALAAPADDVRALAAERVGDAGSRLTGYELPEPERMSYTPDPRLLKGGLWEKAAGIAGAGLEGLNAFTQMRRPGATSQPQVMQRPHYNPAPFVDPDNPWSF